MAKKKGHSLTRVVWPSSTSPALPRHLAKIGRNDPCPCGSGKKYKDCHQKEGEAFLEKLARKEDKERVRQLREDLKTQGVPWYRRLFRRA
jgi:SEC-C motif